METRFKDPMRSRELFKEVLEMDSNHFEARLKLSWHEIRFGNAHCTPGLLEPVVASPTATLEQKQRAYNNLSCAFLVMVVPDAVKAEKWAIAGIQLDGRGSPKLWENLGGAYKEQGRLHEAVDAFTKSLLMDPTSKHSKRNIKAIEKEIKNQGKSMKKDKQKDKVKVKKDKKEIKYNLHTEDKENVVNMQRSTSSASLFKKQKSEKSIGKVMHC